MARICENCKKGIGYGHAVSHAKNRVRRIFKPNLQKIRVLTDGQSVRVILCTNCIQRLKRDSTLGKYKLFQYMKQKEISQEVRPVKEVKKPESVAPAKELEIEDIVGKA
ncbi:50S ribosomal protein L28 [Candidatus Gottesmanbacteria bacterium RIFCSPHIGHO2_02_FULL_40_24]|uniref:Large ribosomal subunit protein bL28 n=1 Tax=Candidatus Gottesmanbacteria bacterium RIFCSPHIGHO2_01_FULL_40_15 TaxID=1798376 RepID=A0A1F5YZZ6_9BACT|nr:MAG: 50S ribosomal protein L28 [Candidatus Gottesmanbacteria bacterium RIFCSPHIGHO2_01_FULL_40_15]OGG16363.1 MAG: 50S ribosomal protein L28 [Candidatus Gottesmanbacteria bacterium RIFCSPHIGHO2_02_FULL_40_24]OGG21298.1 MAG: 50S ribosomal protein L28 [Candidatus Gottesmanbacteria bacterium RIFCSPLOWO2_01_FULL_40_10]OGG23437.1 MAG: 50S ribosomal protein L28 [Candidatus Gottesmanbacteria bacterium RIFCSPHIGHO2_12_FULL_40_13]OGG33035.1 MAG: 50S ribosomal protein L28 [Candidatus Gottesmanbacteria 